MLINKSKKSPAQSTDLFDLIYSRTVSRPPQISSCPLDNYKHAHTWSRTHACYIRLYKSSHLVNKREPALPGIRALVALEEDWRGLHEERRIKRSLAVTPV